MQNNIKIVSVHSIVKGVAEVAVNGETQGFICEQDNPKFPAKVKLSGGYVLGEFDCFLCALKSLVQLHTRIAALNDLHRADYAARVPYLSVIGNASSLINQLGEPTFH